MTPDACLGVWPIMIPAPTRRVAPKHDSGGLLAFCYSVSARCRQSFRAVTENHGMPPQPMDESPGDSSPDRLLEMVYDELRRLAAAKLARESAAHTLQPTALVHEAWLRLGGDAQSPWANRRHFFAAAAESMRRILIDTARRKSAARRGANATRISADATGFDLAAPETDETLLLVDEALDALAGHDPRKAELVKLKYFGGLTLEEAAATLDISLRTAKRDWTYARAWLFQEITRLRGD